MTDKMNFAVFCLESYKLAHNLKGKDVIEIFNQYKVFDYIKSFFDVLHSTGQKYIVEDLDIYIRSRQN